MSELADAVVLDRSALGHNLRPLERDGLIQLRPNENDARSRVVVLTQKGRAKLKQARRLWQTAQRTFEAVFGAKEAAALRATLDQLSTLNLSAP